MGVLEKKMFKQFRAIRNYAHSEDISFELACDQWCEGDEDSLAKQWAEQN